MNCKKYPKVDNRENYNIGLNITSSYNTNNNNKKKNSIMFPRKESRLVN